MSIAEVKASIYKRNARQRREIGIHLLNLRAVTPTWKKETARRLREAKAGKSVTSSQVEALIAAMPCIRIRFALPRLRLTGRSDSPSAGPEPLTVL